MSILELITDPTSEQLSMSRLGLLLMLIISIVWTIGCILNIPPKHTVVPVCSMLGTITVGVCTIYAANSTMGAWRRPYYPHQPGGGGGGNGKGDGET